jgi:phosphorylcholine metabolism protein LicD
MTMRDNNSGINEIYRKMISKLQTLIKRNIPTVKVRVSRKYPKNVRKLISKERKVCRKYRKSCEQKYLESYVNLNRKIFSELNKIESQKIKKLIEKCHFLKQGCPTGGPPVGFVRPARANITIY